MNSIFLAFAVSLSLFASEAVDPTLGAARFGTDQVFVARPDIRDCFPALPYCGGRFMHQITRPVEHLCTDKLPLAGYVTRVVVREDNGTLTELDPPCDQPLPGQFEEDPLYPGFNMFVVLAYAT